MTAQTDTRALVQRLTLNQIECLLALKSFNYMAPWEPIAPDVSRKAFRPPYWALEELNALHRMGLANRNQGWGGPTWRISSEGKDVAALIAQSAGEGA